MSDVNEQYVSKYTAAEIEAILDKVKTDMEVIQFSQQEIATLLTKIDDLVLPTVPTKVSDLENDSHFIDNTVNNLSNYYSKSKINELLNLQNNNYSFLSIYKAPLHDTSNTIADGDIVTGYDAFAKNVEIIDDNKRMIKVKFSGTNLKSHTNGAGTNGYWMGIAVPDSILLGGYTVQFTRGFGTVYDIDNLEFTTMDSNYFEADTNISSTGKYCSFYREVGEAKQNSGHAFVIFKYSKSGTDPIYYIYDYDYTDVTLV